MANSLKDDRYTRDRNVWGDTPFYLVKQPQEKWACDFCDDAPPLSFRLQVAEVHFLVWKKIHNGKIAIFRNILGQSWQS